MENKITLIFKAGGKKKNLVIKNAKDPVKGGDVKALMEKIIEKKFVHLKTGEPVEEILGAKNVKTEVEEIDLDSSEQ